MKFVFGSLLVSAVTAGYCGGGPSIGADSFVGTVSFQPVCGGFTDNSGCTSGVCFLLFSSFLFFELFLFLALYAFHFGRPTQLASLT
jgi:hypothetical protein